jgi:hypothetical protein
MSDTAHAFIRGNLLSPVVKCNTTAKGGASYRLADGNTYKLSKAEFVRLGEIMGRTGFSIRLAEDQASTSSAR